MVDREKNRRKWLLTHSDTIHEGILKIRMHPFLCITLFVGPSENENSW